MSTISSTLPNVQAQSLMVQAREALKLPIPASVSPENSLTLNAEALKAQDEALSLLDSVLATASEALSRIAPLWQERQALTDGEAQATLDEQIRGVLQSATYGKVPLFDLHTVNAATLDGLLAPNASGPLSLFSEPVRAELTDAFERAFDLYA